MMLALWLLLQALSLLGVVKTEFAKFGDVVEATKKSIDAAAKKFDEVGVRTRAIQRTAGKGSSSPWASSDARHAGAAAAAGAPSATTASARCNCRAPTCSG
jgi:DNA anti-recombination protein RmuC